MSIHRTSRPAPLCGAAAIGRRAFVPILSLLLVACGTGGTQGGSTGDAAAKIPFGIVDVPTQNQPVKGIVTFSGWAIGDDGISRVAVYADRAFVKDAVLGVSRPDVAKVHPGLKNNESSGWTVSIDVGGLPPGPHEMTFQAFTPAGAVRELATRTVVVTP